MVNIFIAFITGLTTGGLSCLAVQGGLLASSLAGQIEMNYRSANLKTGRKKQRRNNQARKPADLATPIVAFLAAKIIAYTLMGFLLGLVGQMFQLTPYTRAFLQIGIGIFMLGTALRMLNVHPIFRYFAFEPPTFLRRKLRQTAAAGEEKSSLSTPVFLGFLTVFIPCGVTQAMMAVALATADPLQAAALMAAFTLGTSPVFFAVSYFATRLGAKLEKTFMRIVAVVVLILAIITIDSGAALAGSPFSLNRWVSSAFSRPGEVVAAPLVPGIQQGAPAPANSSGQATTETAGSGGYEEGVVTVRVENWGYAPEVAHAQAGIPIQLRLVSENVRSCSLAFVIPSLGVQKLLEPTGETVIEIAAQEPGTELRYSCSMGMYGGTIIFDL